MAPGLGPRSDELDRGLSYDWKIAAMKNTSIIVGLNPSPCTKKKVTQPFENETPSRHVNYFIEKEYPSGENVFQRTSCVNCWHPSYIFTLKSLTRDLVSYRKISVTAKSQRLQEARVIPVKFYSVSTPRDMRKENKTTPSQQNTYVKNSLRNPHF